MPWLAVSVMSERLENWLTVSFSFSWFNSTQYVFDICSCVTLVSTRFYSLRVNRGIPDVPLSMIVLY
jgi:hypothetical protein